jgi:uncharacterized protein
MTTPPAAVDVSAEHRIETLDILRGFALFGMIVVHFHQRFRLTAQAEWPGEWLVGWIVWWGLESKAWATFALLFGAGFAIVIRRAAATERPIVAPYLRRLAVLALIGVVLEALTDIGILLHYAIWGVPLLLVRRWTTSALLVLAVAAAMAMPAWYVAADAWRSRSAVAATPAAAAPAPPRPESWGATVVHRLNQLRADILTWRVVIPDSSFALFLVGFLAVRRGVFDDPKRHLRLIAGAMLLGAASWILHWFVLRRIPSTWTIWMTHPWPLHSGMGLISDQWLAFTYVGALTLLLAYRADWIRRFSVIGMCGRLALTAYVIQAMVIELLWSRFWLGVRLTPYQYVFGSVSLFSALLLFSAFWLVRYRYGPLEWLWRASTYLRLPTMRRIDSPAHLGAYAREEGGPA